MAEEPPFGLPKVIKQLESILAQLDITLSALRDAAYDATNDRKKISIENDAVGLAKETTLSGVDSKLGDLREALSSVGTDKLLTTPDNPPNLDIAISALRDALLDPIVDELIKNNETIDAAGESSVYNIRGAKHVDVLIYVGTPTGSPSITFHLQVIEPTSGKVIRTYDGSSLTAEGPDYITVDGLTLGTHVKVTWDGTLDTSNYFTGCFVRIVAKR